MTTHFISTNDAVVSNALSYLENSYILEIPTVTTYPDFARDFLESSLVKDENVASMEVTDEMVRRCLSFFEQSLVEEIPTIVTYPDFICDLLNYSFLGFVAETDSEVTANMVTTSFGEAVQKRINGDTARSARLSVDS